MNVLINHFNLGNSNKCNEFLQYLFLEYSEIGDDAGFEKQYLSWEPIHEYELVGGNMVAVISVSGCFLQSEGISFPDEKKYWTPESPIDLTEYPNCISTIYRRTNTGNLYLVYREFGGHIPELRCRLIQKELLIPLSSVPVK